VGSSNVPEQNYSDSNRNSVNSLSQNNVISLHPTVKPPKKDQSENKPIIKKSSTVDTEHKAQDEEIKEGMEFVSDYYDSNEHVDFMAIKSSLDGLSNNIDDNIDDELSIEDILQSRPSIIDE